METRWRIDNDSLANRELELHLGKSVWQNITEHLNRRRLAEEAIEKKRQHTKYLKDTSKEMTKDWKNILFKDAQPNAETKLLEKMEEDKRKIELYKETTKHYEEERRKYIEAKRKSIYMKKSYPNQLNSALLYSEAQYENQQQIELNKKIKVHEQEVKNAFDEQVREAAQADVKEKEEYKNKVRQTQKEMAETLLKEIENHNRQRNTKREQKMNDELEEARKAQEEIEMRKKTEEQQLSDKRQKIYKDITDCMERKRLLSEMLKRENTECDSINTIYKEAKDKIYCTIKEKHRDTYESTNLRNEPFIKQREEEERQILIKEEERLNKQMKEKEEFEEKVFKDKKDRRDELVAERLEDVRQYRERHEKINKNNQELRNWELLNRYKANEAITEYDEQLKKKQWQEILKYRAELNKQIEENKCAKQKEIEADIAYKKHLDDSVLSEDNQFLTYAKEVRDLASSKNRKTYPIDKVVYQYKKHYGIPLPNRNHQFCRDVSSDICRNQANLVNKTSGKMAHDPNSDPNYKNKCVNK